MGPGRHSSSHLPSSFPRYQELAAILEHKETLSRYNGTSSLPRPKGRTMVLHAGWIPWASQPSSGGERPKMIEGLDKLLGDSGQPGLLVLQPPAPPLRTRP